MEDYQEKIERKTKDICICTFVSIVIIILFSITPLRNIFAISSIMKIIAIFILAYAIYLNINQSFILQNVDNENRTRDFINQLNANILCSYTFTLFLILLLISTIKNIF